jgi:hypothetical protein
VRFLGLVTAYRRIDKEEGQILDKNSIYLSRRKSGSMPAELFRTSFMNDDQSNYSEAA